MKTELRTITVRDMVTGFSFDSSSNLGGSAWGGKVIIHPEYQREFFYNEARNSSGETLEESLIKTLLAGAPCGLIVLREYKSGEYDVLDGQQRITSIGRFMSPDNSVAFSVSVDGTNPRKCSQLSVKERDLLYATELAVKVICYTGDPADDKITMEWFKRANTPGRDLNEQEIRSAVYAGPFVKALRERFIRQANQQDELYMDVKRDKLWHPKGHLRQAYLECALRWTVAQQHKGESTPNFIDEYLAHNRYNPDIGEVTRTVEAIYQWISGIFNKALTDVLVVKLNAFDWGRLYFKYNKLPREELIRGRERMIELGHMDTVGRPMGLVEYVLSGEDPKKICLLNIRGFDSVVKERVYRRQRKEAEAAGKSNCPMCASLPGPDHDHLYDLNEMHADHIIPWSKGGPSTEENCQLLCKTHNLQKSNSMEYADDSSVSSVKKPQKVSIPASGTSLDL